MIYLKLAWGFLRDNWRWMLPLAGIAAVFAVLAYARHEHDVAQHATQQAATAERHAQAEHRGTQAVERTVKREARLDKIANEEIAHVRELPDADTPLDPERRDRLCAALERVYDAPGCDSPDPKGPLPNPDNPNADARG